MNYQAAIFDVDGTLLDSMPIWKNAGKRYLEAQGCVPQENLSDVLESMSLAEGAEYLRQTYDLPGTTDDVIQGFVDLVHDFYCYEVELKPQIKDLLQQLYLQKIPMVIATSSDRSYVEAALQRHGIDRYFKRIFTSGEVGVGKKQPDIYLTAASYLGFPPKEICVFEDAYYAMETAKKAGFQLVGIYDISNARYEKQSMEICDFYVR